MVLPDFLAGVPLADRERVLTERRCRSMNENKQKKDQCLRCILNPGNCICAELVANRPSSDQIVPFQIAVCMHVKEKYRTSNTGKIFSYFYDSLTAIDSEQVSMTALSELIAANHSNAIVLFPSEDAVEVSEISPEILARPLILVPDGTWKQAGRLVRCFPSEIPRVKINPRTLSRFLCRTQTTVDRVCTAEAVALLLQDLGHQVEADRVFTGLEIIQRGFNRQTFHQDERPAANMKRRKPRPTLKSSSSM